jgi:hypothetical protein
MHGGKGRTSTDIDVGDQQRNGRRDNWSDTHNIPLPRHVRKVSHIELNWI